MTAAVRAASAEAAAGAAQGPSRSRRQGRARRHADGELEGRAGQRRPRPAVGSANLPPSTGSTTPTARNSASRSSSACAGTARSSILRQFERRLQNDVAAETKAALTEVFRIGRCASTSGSRRPTGSRSTAGSRPTCSTPMRGHPAPGVAVELAELSAHGEPRIIASATHQSRRPHRPAADRRAADPDRTLRIALPRRRLFRAAGHAAVRPAVPRRGAGPVRGRRSGRPLSRAAAGHALELFDLSGQLMRATRLTWE